MNLEEMLRLYRELGQNIQQLEEQKKALGKAICEQIPEKKLEVGGYIAKKYHRLSIKTPLHAARLIDAVKMEEVVDKEKIKTLYESGQSIEGVAPLEWVQVTLSKRLEEIGVTNS